MLLDAKYDSYTDQQLMAEASSFELGYAKTGCNIETAKELYYKAFSKFGNLYARNKWIQLKSELKGQEETVTREHNSDSHSYVITQQNNCYEDNTFELDIPENELPTVIAKHFSELEKLRNSVNMSCDAADLAKQSADVASRWVQDEHGVWIFKWKSDNTKETINNLQKAATDLAKAQQSAAEAQKFTFENQEKIGQIIRYLFALGASNIAANRSIVNRLKHELEGMPKGQLNEMARQEIYAVIRQLKTQEDLLNKQKNQGEILREHDDHFKQIEDVIKELSEKQSNSLTKEEHNNDLKEYIEKLEGLKNLISDAEKGLLDKIGKRQTIENAKQEKQAFIDAVEEQKQAIHGLDTKFTETAEAQKKALAEEVQNRNEQIKQLTEQQKQTLQEVDTKFTETAEAQKKALAEEVQNRNEQIKQLTEQQKQTLQELEQRNNEELDKIDAKYNDDVRSLTNSIDEYKNICYKQEREIEDLKNKLNDLNVLANNKVEKNTAIGIALLAIIALCVAVMPFIH